MDKPFKTFKEQVEILNGENGDKLRVKTDTVPHLKSEYLF